MRRPRTSRPRRSSPTSSSCARRPPSSPTRLTRPRRSTSSTLRCEFRSQISKCRSCRLRAANAWRRGKILALPHSCQPPVVLSPKCTELTMPSQGERPTSALGAVLQGDNAFRLLVEAVTDYAIYMLDPEGHVASWNSGAQRFKAYTASEIIGRHFSEFYTPEDQDAGLPARVLETAEREGKFEGEGWRVRKDGGRFWAHVVIDPIRDRSGRLLGFAKITRDLTERKAAEETLRAAQEDFELLVQSVTDYAIYRLDPAG